MRPTGGRVELSGGMPMGRRFDVGGWFATGPGVLRRVGEALLEGDGARAAIRRLIVAEDAFAVADAEVAALSRKALARMAEALPKPEAATIAPDGLDSWREAFRI